MTAWMYTQGVSGDLDSHRKRLEMAVETGLDRCRHPRVFFRADDIGVPGTRVFRMMDAFLAFRVPLCLAVVPAWLTRVRWEAMDGRANAAGNLFCWHQHGWRHRNHEPRGKKQEFGPARAPRDVRRDLDLGRTRLEEILGARFSLFFTPPWNRCSDTVLGLLASAGFRGVSRSHGSLPPVPDGLAEHSVNVDLHTRREPTADSGWDGLYSDLAEGLASGVCGVMLHHNRMNGPSLRFLELMLEVAGHYPDLELVTFDSL